MCLLFTHFVLKFIDPVLRINLKQTKSPSHQNRCLKLKLYTFFAAEIKGDFQQQWNVLKCCRIWQKICMSAWVEKIRKNESSRTRWSIITHRNYYIGNFSHSWNLNVYLTQNKERRQLLRKRDKMQKAGIFLILIFAKRDFFFFW